MKINYLPILFFKDKHCEKRFQTYFAKLFIRQNRIASLLAIIIIIVFSPWDYYALNDNASHARTIRFVIIIPLLAILLSLSFSSFYQNHEQILLAIFIYLVILCIMALSFTLSLGDHSSLNKQQALGLDSAVGALNISIALFFSGSVFATRFYITTIIMVLSFITYSYLTLAILQLDIVIYLLYALNIATTVLLVIYGSFRREESLRQSFLINEKSNALLNRVYPHSIAKRLKKNETLITDKIPHASILFADLSAFTPLASHHSANKMVHMLNEIFSSFDSLIDNPNIEKIKTIGDGYLVLCTSQKPSHNHASIAMNLAISMQAAIQAYNESHNFNLHLKIGIHSGSLVGGVIGNKRPLYDIWGDNVNIASRMESTCPPNHIQISQQTYQLIKENDSLPTDRKTTSHETYIKGKGLLKTYHISPKNMFNHSLIIT